MLLRGCIVMQCVSVYNVSASWPSGLGPDTPSWYLASAGIPTHNDYYHYLWYYCHYYCLFVFYYYCHTGQAAACGH